MEEKSEGSRLPGPAVGGSGRRVRQAAVLLLRLLWVQRPGDHGKADADQPEAALDDRIGVLFPQLSGPWSQQPRQDQRRPEQGNRHQQRRPKAARFSEEDDGNPGQPDGRPDQECIGQDQQRRSQQRGLDTARLRPAQARRASENDEQDERPEQVGGQVEHAVAAEVRNGEGLQHHDIAEEGRKIQRQRAELREIGIDPGAAEESRTRQVEHRAKHQAWQEYLVKRAEVPRGGCGRAHGRGPPALQDQAGEYPVKDEEDGIGFMSEAGQEIEAGGKNCLRMYCVIADEEQEAQVIHQRDHGAGPAGDQQKRYEAVVHMASSVTCAAPDHNRFGSIIPTARALINLQYSRREILKELINCIGTR